MTGKVITLTLVLLGLQTLMSFAGYLPEQGLLLNTFDIITNPGGITLGALFASINSTLTLIGAAGVIVGFITSENTLIWGGVASFMAAFVADFASVLKYINGKEGIGGVFGPVVTLLYGTLMVVYLLSIIDWWRGTD